MSPEGAEAGDPEYAGFRITELWAVVAVDPEDDQEGICAINAKGAWMPLVASDGNRRDTLLRQQMNMLRIQGVDAQLKHFRLVDDEAAETPDPGGPRGRATHDSQGD